MSQFRSRFGSQGAIYLNQDTLFALQPGSHRKLSESGNRRKFARIVASTEQFGGKYFRSLADQFGVSTEAMAIRLEELDLAKV